MLPRLSTFLLALAAGAAGTAAAQQAQPATVAAHKAASPAGATTYRVVNLGSGPLTELPKINAKGQVVFSLDPDGSSHGYFYNGTAVQDIGTLGSAGTYAVDLNDAGQVTGSSNVAEEREHAFVWSAAGGMLDIGVLPGARTSRGNAINSLGVVTGGSEGIPAFAPRAFRWSAADGMENLGAAPSLGNSSFSSAINDASLIAGTSDVTALVRQAFAWTRTGGLVNIDTLGSFYSDSAAVGAGGEVAGYRIPAEGTPYRAFFWTQTGGMLDLGTGSGIESFAIAMSPGTHIAGLVNLADGRQRAMSWTRAGGMRVLGTLGGLDSRATQLNNKGQIVGAANNKKQEPRAFLWSGKTGMVDLNTRLRHAPPGLVLDHGLAINDSGAIVASSNAGLVLLKPATCCKGGLKEGPAVGPIKAPELVKPGAPLRASVAWVDPDRVGIRSLTWSWGDGSSGAGRMRENRGAGSASASHSYAAPGIYALTASLVDGSGRRTAVSHSVVVAPPGGAVAGAGAVMSPLGAFAQAPLHSGKAHFSLFAPAANGALGQLRFDLPGLNLRSSSLKLLGRQGNEQVFEGSGSIGGGKVQFRLATSIGVAGGEPGRFGLRIWKTDPVSKKDVVVYDNRRTQTAVAASRLVEGKIVQE